LTRLGNRDIIKTLKGKKEHEAVGTQDWLS